MDFSTINIDNMSEDELIFLFSEIREYQKYNKLELMKPYPYQLDFMNKSSKYHQRVLRAGNRIGKTYGAAIEFAQHITGRYQDYFKGDRFTESGHTFWCIGIEIDSTAKVMQKELLGTSDCRNVDMLGTGSIPKSCIDFTSIRKDGGNIQSIRIKHIDGGYNDLFFYASSQGQDRLMGQAVKLAWLDEEAPFNSLELYSQVVTRTATTDGHVMMTFTPEHGNTPLNQLFDEDKTGELYIASVTWDDCPHLTESIKKRLLAGIPTYQHDMRTKGLPVLGQGAVYPFPDIDLEVNENITPADHWRLIAGIDFGQTIDPSVVIFAAFDPDNEHFYILKECYLDDDRSPKAIAKAILTSGYPNIPVVVPHDAGNNTGNPEAKGMMLASYGVNVIREPFKNPSYLNMSIWNKGSNQSVRGIEAGLEEIRRLMREKRLSVYSGCVHWFTEKRGYFYKHSSTTGIVKPSGADHCLDASRYALLTLADNKGATVHECLGVARSPEWSSFTPSFSYDEDSTADNFPF